MTILAPAAPGDIPVIMSWIATKEDCAIWGGPGFRYPFTQKTFSEDLLLQHPSYMLREGARAVGFGQCYQREGRRHLARLIIAPEARSRGFGSRLISALLQTPSQDASADETSLFVKHINPRAAELYRRMGFEVTPYPGELTGFDDCDYMIAPVEKVLTFCKAS